MSVLDAFRLDGRVAVVTGGNRGLGFAFARALGEAGARVAIAARDAGKNVEAAAALDALGVELDVTDPASVAAMAERVTEELGPIDVLVNNAGACFPARRSRFRRSGGRSGTSTSTGSGIARAWWARRWSRAVPA